MGKVFVNRVQRRSLAYAALVLGLLGARISLRHFTWVGNAEIHTILETVATLLALVTGAMALVRYYSQETVTYLILGSAFLGAGLLDGSHTVVTSSLCTECTPSSLSALIPWTGTLSRLFLSMLMCASLFAWRGVTPGRRHERAVYLVVGSWTLASF